MHCLALHTAFSRQHRNESIFSLVSHFVLLINESSILGETHPFWQVWDRHRLLASKLIENKYFEGIVLILILISSFVMTLEDIWFETKHTLIGKENY